MTIFKTFNTFWQISFKKSFNTAHSHKHRRGVDLDDGNAGPTSPDPTPGVPGELVSPHLMKMTAWLAEDGRHPFYWVGVDTVSAHSRVSTPHRSPGCRSGPLWKVHFSVCVLLPHWISCILVSFRLSLCPQFLPTIILNTVLMKCIAKLGNSICRSLLPGTWDIHSSLYSFILHPTHV